VHLQKSVRRLVHFLARAAQKLHQQLLVDLVRTHYYALNTNFFCSVNLCLDQEYCGKRK
jgi:hypothetical protein